MCTARHNALDFGQQLIEFEVLRISDVFKWNLLIDILYDADFQGRFVHHRLHHHVVRTCNLVLFDIFFDEVDKRLTKLLCLTSADSGNLRQLLHSDRILDGHVFQRRILEDDEWRQVFLLRYGLTKVFQHREQGLVGT